MRLLFNLEYIAYTQRTDKMIIEIIALLIGIVVLYLLFKLTKSLIGLVIHAILALLVLLGLDVLGFGIVINIWSVLIVALGGFIGLVLVVALHILRIAF